jgi:hypothetical protein
MDRSSSSQGFQSGYPLGGGGLNNSPGSPERDIRIAPGIAQAKPTPPQPRLVINAQTEEAARKQFELLQKGLTVVDRKHISFFVGDGKNGSEKGKFYLRAEKDHKSRSGNFQAIQAIANNGQETVTLAIVGPEVKFESRVGVKQNNTVTTKPFEEIYGVKNYVSKADAVPGQTLFPLRGAPRENVLYSNGKNTEVYVATDQPDKEIVATLYHELRAHVVPSKMGRDPAKGSHGDGNVNAIGKAAEKEARINFDQIERRPRVGR